MNPFREGSIRAAFRADFNDQLPLLGPELNRLYEARDRREAASVLGAMRTLFAPLTRYRPRREAPDALGLRPFTPPF